MESKLHEKNGNILYILNILKKYSDEDHILTAKEITNLVKEEYGVDNDDRTIRRNISLLKEKFGYDISTKNENKKGYYLIKDYYSDFDLGEIRTIIDTISFAPYITKEKSRKIIGKCMDLLNNYELDKLDDYKIVSDNIKTLNDEVINNIESIYDAIYNNKKISFTYNHYVLDSNKLAFKPTSNEIRIVSPYKIVNSIQEFYLICVKKGEDKLKTYRIDRMTNLKVLDEELNNNIDKKEIQEFIDSQISMFGGKPINITIKCEYIMLDNVVELLGRNLNYKMYDDKHFKVDISVNEDAFINWYLRNLGKIEVLKPLSLKEKINDKLKDNIK